MRSLDPTPGLPLRSEELRGAIEAPQRLRSIMLTVITTVSGLVPMTAPLFFPAIFGRPERAAAFYGPIGLSGKKPLVFRDYLRDHPAEVAAYGRLTERFGRYPIQRWREDQWRN